MMQQRLLKLTKALSIRLQSRILQQRHLCERVCYCVRRESEQSNSIRIYLSLFYVFVTRTGLLVVVTLPLHYIYINIQSNIDLMDVCCSGRQSTVTVLPSKKDVVPFFFFHVWRLQFPCGSIATDVPKRTDLIILAVWGGKGSV